MKALITVFSVWMCWWNLSQLGMGNGAFLCEVRGAAFDTMTMSRQIQDKDGASGKDIDLANTSASGYVGHGSLTDF